MYMREWISVQLQENKNGTKTVGVVVDSERSFRFDLSVFPHTPGDEDDDLCLRHLERLFHTDPSDSSIQCPPPDIADTRELLENQSVDVDTMVISPNDIAGELILMFPEFKQNHNIKGRAAILIIEGDIGLLDIEIAAKALEGECNTDVLPVSFYKGDIPSKVYASLWWFDRRKWSWET